MKEEKVAKEYSVTLHGIPDFSQIPNAALEPIINKILENILRELKGAEA